MTLCLLLSFLPLPLTLPSTTSPSRPSIIYPLTLSPSPPLHPSTCPPRALHPSIHSSSLSLPPTSIHPSIPPLFLPLSPPSIHLSIHPPFLSPTLSPLFLSLCLCAGLLPGLPAGVQLPGSGSRCDRLHGEAAVGGGGPAGTSAGHHYQRAGEDGGGRQYPTGHVSLPRVLLRYRPHPSPGLQLRCQGQRWRVSPFL